jgi:hypothetical protein
MIRPIRKGHPGIIRRPSARRFRSVVGGTGTSPNRRR